MSFCYFHGIVPVCDGRRVQTVRANGSSVWHTIYDSMLLTETGSDVSGTVRAFAPASMSNLPSDSLIIVHGKFMFPIASDTAEFGIDTLNFDAFIADPSVDNYDSFLPVNKVSTLTLLGNVVGSMIQMNDGSKGVDVKVSSYMRGKTVEGTFR